MTDPGSGSILDPDRHGRRAVWIAFTLTMLGAAIVYKAKAEDDRSAFVRWRHQVLELADGTNIWDKYYFPNPPIFPISLYPFAVLPTVTGALVWFGLKAILAATCMIACMRMAAPPGARFPSWAQAALVLLCMRPILGDLHHANNNLIILSLIVATFAAWRRGYDVLAGACLALAITYKVTPALFIPYFLYKRSWRTVAATFVGIGVFLLVVPSLILGPIDNAHYLASWYRRILSPYLEKGEPSAQEVNQSMVGVVSRLLTTTAQAGQHGYKGTQFHLNVLALPPHIVGWIVKGISLAFVVLLALFCRTKTRRRDDPRLMGEVALVVLTMLFVSERSWKNHFVTVVFPYAFLVAHVAVLPGPKGRKFGLAGLLLLSSFLMACTSSEFGFLFGKNGHKVAQFYGLFFLAGLVLYGATAWRVVADRDKEPVLEGISRTPPPPPHLGFARIESKETKS